MKPGCETAVCNDLNEEFSDFVWMLTQHCPLVMVIRYCLNSI